MNGSDDAAATDAVLEHFGSLMRNVSAWHAPEFLGLDVTMSQAKCLYVVSLHPGIGMSAMSDHLGVGLSAVSGLVDRLFEHGYLERHEDPSDRRQQQLSLTVAGATVVDRIRELNVEHLRALLEGLDSAELEALRVGIAALDRQARLTHDDKPAGTDPSHERTSA